MYLCHDGIHKSNSVYYFPAIGHEANKTRRPSKPLCCKSWHIRRGRARRCVCPAACGSSKPGFVRESCRCLQVTGERKCKQGCSNRGRGSVREPGAAHITERRLCGRVLELNLTGRHTQDWRTLLPPRSGDRETENTSPVSGVAPAPSTEWFKASSLYLRDGGGGVKVCKRIRATAKTFMLYKWLLFLTIKGQSLRLRSEPNYVLILALFPLKRVHWYCSHQPEGLCGNFNQT